MMTTRWRRIGVGAVAVVACVALAASSSTENTPTRVGAGGTVTTAGAGGPTTTTDPGANGGQAPTTTAPEVFTVGDEVKLGDWTVVVTTVTDPWISTNTFDKPKGRYVAIDTTVKNLSATPQTVSSLMCFELRDATGRSFNKALVGGNDAKAPDGEVDPNGMLRGTLVFDVPADATGLSLRFKCDLFESGSATINLG
jgi:hypothetical protein